MRAISMISDDLVNSAIVASKLFYEDLMGTIKEDYMQDIDQEKIDYTPTGNEMAIVDAFKENLPQLAPFVIFALSCVLAKIGLHLIAVPSAGKSKIMGAIKKIVVYKSSNNLSNKSLLSNHINPLSLDKIDENKNLEILSNSNYDIIIDDFTKMIYSSKVPIKEVIPILSSLVQVHSYKSDVMNIENANISLIGGMTSEGYETLRKEEAWRNQGRDRFVRLFLFYYRRPNPKVYLKEDEYIVVPDVEINGEVPYPEGENIDDLKAILAHQISYDRTDSFIRRILQGHAMLCNKPEVDGDDIKWFKLYTPLLIHDSDFSYVKNTILFNVTKKGDGIKIKDLSAQSAIPEDEISKAISEFKEIGTSGEKIVLKESRWLNMLRRLHETYTLT